MTLARAIALAMKAPVHAYQWTVRPWLGWPCRHLPTCSDYALDALDRNGAWKGGWLVISRLARCQPWGTHGYDPVPDLGSVRHPLYACYRYGRWSRCNDQLVPHPEPAIGPRRLEREG